MDLQTGLIYVGVVVVSAAVILFVSMFGIKEKSYEEAIAEQRRLPDDLLIAKKDKGKDKKHKSKTGKKVKEKKEEKDEKDEKSEHVQFEETPVILSSELNVQETCKGHKKKNKPDKVKPILVNKEESSAVMPELIASQSSLTEVNRFDVMHPKDEVELIRSQSKENLHYTAQAEIVINKSPKETPTKSKKNVAKEMIKRKEEIKEEKRTEVNAKELNVNIQPTLSTSTSTKEPAKELKELQKDTQKDIAVSLQSSTNKESKKNKKKNDILAQIGGDKDGINVSLLMPLVQKAELSRSEIQILIDQLLNKQMDNPMEHSEWTEGRADPVIKLKKQLAEKDKALTEEHETSVTFQNKLKELRAELNSERSRLTANVKQLEETLNVKITEVQTLHTRMQHILESHAAEKQGFARQIEQLQSKVNEDSTIIHKMQEDQGQTQGHLQQELIAQRKQLEVQFSQMRENENALKSQLAQKHVEVQELQNVNISVTQELQATCESSSAEIEMLRQELAIMQDQCMHSESQLQHMKEAGERLQELSRQLDESHRVQNDLEHRLKNTHRHEQELQKQLHSLQGDLKILEVEVNNVSTLKAELNKLQNELMKFEYEAEEVKKLRSALINKDEEVKNMQVELMQMRGDVNRSDAEMKKLELALNEKSNEVNELYSERAKTIEELTQTKSELMKVVRELTMAQDNFSQVLVNARTANEGADIASDELKLIKDESMEKLLNGGLRDENKSLASQLASITERPAAEGRENGVEEKLEKQNAQPLQYTNALAEKEKELEKLSAELLKNQTEFSKLSSTIENLRWDLDNQKVLNQRLQDNLELQRKKNNENRDKIRNSEQEFTKSLLQRIFPQIQIHEQSYNKWIEAFEQDIKFALVEKSQNENIQDNNLEMEKENRKLQDLVAYYQQIIVKTEGMLSNLQKHVESEESKWQSALRLQENELRNLRYELKELQDKQTSTDNLQEKISQLESRLKEEEKLREQVKAEFETLKSSHKTSIISGNFNLGEFEQLQEQKQRLLQDLETERDKVNALNAELNKLQQLRNASSVPGGSSGHTLNGPNSSDTPKIDEQTRTAHSLIAPTEKFNCELNSENCHTPAHDTQSIWNPMNSQQQKKHKKKRKGGSGKKVTSRTKPR